MSYHFYNWLRYWYPRSETLYLLEGGFLPDPQIQHWQVRNPKLVKFADISALQCLILLAEPGVGKSTELEKYAKLYNANEALYFDFGSQDIDKLFETGQFKAWAENDCRLHLFLDSLDESSNKVPRTAKNLLTELKRQVEAHPDALQRLFLRISCRQTDWSDFLEKGLEQLFGQITVYYLAPLTRENVIQAVQIKGYDDKSFMNGLYQKRLVTLACKPITLNFLLNTFRDGAFPSTQIELYQRGCLLLCEEMENRSVKTFEETADAIERFKIASQLAVLTIFSGCRLIWRGIDKGNVLTGNGISTIREIIVASAKVDNPYLSEGKIKDVLKSSLFIEGEAGYSRWAHQSYAEFLAANCLVEADLELAQIMSLITLEDGYVAPQLYQTAVWLGLMRSDVFLEVVKTDPQIFLNSELQFISPENRAILAKNLLALYDKKLIPQPNWDERFHYDKLAHPALATQLLPYITNTSKNFTVRDVAIHIAEACQLLQVQIELARLAINPTENVLLREYAALTVIRLEDRSACHHLKPLLNQNLNNLKFARLKGYGLQANWADNLTAQELFVFLDSLDKKELELVCQNFLFTNPLQKLKIEDLPIALDWCQRQKGNKLRAISYELYSFRDAIMLMSCEHLEQPNILPKFCQATIKRFYEYEGLNSTDMYDRPQPSPLGDGLEKRQKVFGFFAPILSIPANNPLILPYAQSPLLQLVDILWLLKYLESVQEVALREAIIRLIKYIFGPRPKTFEVFDALFYAKDIIPDFQEYFEIGLNSPMAQQQKRDYAQTNQQTSIKSLPTAEKIRTDLENIESGKLEAWMKLCQKLVSQPNSRYNPNLELALHELPVWGIAVEYQARIVEAAKKFTLTEDEGLNEWLGTFDHPFWAISGYIALAIILQEEPKFFAKLEANIWGKWIGTVVSLHRSGSAKSLEIQEQITKEAYQKIPSEFLKVFFAFADAYNNLNHSADFYKLTLIWDAQIAGLLLKKVQEPDLNDYNLANILELLFTYKVEGATDFAASLISPNLLQTKTGRERGLIAASQLLSNGHDIRWTNIWLAIQQDEEFGRTLISRVANRVDFRNPLVNLAFKEAELAELYRWLVKQYPHATDLEHFGTSYIVMERDRITEYRNILIYQLVNLGTEQACEELKKLNEELPNLEFLQWQIISARSNMRRNSWYGASANQVFGLISNKIFRLVRNGEELLEVIMLLLKNLEKKLSTKKNPAARDIWDVARNTKGKVIAGKYYPVDENDFSDYVARYLEQELNEKGFVLNCHFDIVREPELRRSRARGTGLRTDIWIKAITINNFSLSKEINLIIEAKGCWNADLMTSMKTQLKKGYLEGNHVCHHGLYLVGWFNCDLWHSNDSRFEKANKFSDIYQLQSDLEQQAKILSDQEIFIQALVINAALI
ncbi:MAG TPA: hypothetical protein VH186_03515 [Chloroflexia bacterium]|nr:hypothetical protein [Chloroflexia bacterium]